MNFCGISMRLDPVQLEMNLEVVQFLVEHGADKNIKSKTTPPQNSFELSNNHCASEQVKKILNET